MNAQLASAWNRLERFTDLAPALLIVVVAVLIGLALGATTQQWIVQAGVVVAVSLIFAAARWPFPALLVLLGSTILLVVCTISGRRALTPFDILLPPVLLASAFGTARRDAHAHVESGPAHERLRAAERGFTRWVVAFYALGALSLIRLAQLSGISNAVDSGLLLLRAIQGLAIYPLCTWWLRSRERVDQAWRAMFVAGLALVAVNLVGVTLWGVKRAGMTLFVTDFADPLASPNEAGTATLLVGVVLLVRQALKPNIRNAVLGGLLVVLLALTQSRSALLAWIVFGVLTLRYVRPLQLVTGTLSIAALLPLLPEAFWTRMARSVAVERGSFEAFSFFQRVYGWKVAWRVFLDEPWLGVGYLGFRFLSHRYNELRVVFITVENYFFEMLVSLGLVGLFVLGVVIVRLFQLGREVGRVAPPGTLAHHMARFHAPLILGLLVAPGDTTGTRRN